MKKNKAISEKADGYWGVVVMLWVLIKFYLKPDIYLSEFVIKPALFLTVSYFFLTKYLNQEFWSFLKFKDNHLYKKIYIFSIYAVIILGFYLAFLNHADTGKIIGINLATSLSEQIFMLSLVFLPKIESSRSVIKAVLKTAILYLFLRLPSLYLNTEFFGSIFVYTLISSFFLFLTTTLVFYKMKNLHYAVWLHFIYLNIITLFYL
ncbi:MAG: hypothetical protein KatS3mg090_0173 [Patescibacteria group bacterium]|nr:MAG: hypothetical protein KatS3mg090_0173 [Patescibacteria group bacterium]